MVFRLKVKHSRREGVNLAGTPKHQKILGRKGSIPGMHGNRRRMKQTDYGKQLREKQKAKRLFCLSEKQFKNYFQKASDRPGVTGFYFLQTLERRLDNVIYRSGMALSRPQARQFATHGLFYVNGRRVDVPSIMLRPGDIVEVHPNKKGSPVFAKNREENKDHTAPSWLKVDMGKLRVEIMALPEEQHFEQLINPQMIVEFYSR